MCEASLYPAAQFETLSYGCSLELPAFAAGTAQGPMWADIVRPDPRTMKPLAGEREREKERVRRSEGRKWETGYETWTA